ncbi:fatty acyl-AMP ligase [Kutzneria buriramensis]|uniref:Acyl-CoA synthetase (AMP-forming)/AMP-acid ligase II n=1 Tax=Kutzneria buriramensis TaxID=1045776 RepID=A0A3E0GWQ3_9PSEU|nr:fatty acyl-AMP ligase [Kutzneria buriramensis]REH28603.1 acyl-CoA synthetase (AMP-forming)/AMP-acid ligase II [Kutzneria buriramensis]
MTRQIADALNVTELLQAQAAAQGERAAVLMARRAGAGSGDCLSFAALDAEARRIGSRLGERLRPGARVLLLYPRGVEFAAAFFGCCYAGMIAVPAPLPGQYRYQRQRLAAIAADATISAVLTVRQALPEISSWIAESGQDGLLTLVTDDPDAAGPDVWSMPPTDRDTVALLQYTSGSTGSPKGVVVTHGNLLHNVAALLRAYGHAGPLRCGGWVPMYHDMGLIGHLLPGLFSGGGVVLMSPTEFVTRPHRWLEVIDEYDLAMSAAPNFGYERCVRHVSQEQIAQLDLSRWEYAANGSEPIRAATLAAFAKRFAAAGFRATSFFPSYGMAEATLIVSGSSKREPVVTRADPKLLERHEFAPARPGVPGRDVVSCGVPADGIQLRVVDPTTSQVLPAGRIGELWLRGDSVAKGYWRNDAATQAAFQARTADDESGYLRTGDLGVIHEGELYVTGRIKELLIIKGRNVYPQDIEHQIRAEHEELANGVGAVFTVDVAGWEETVVTHEIGAERDPERLRELAIAIRATVSREFGLYAAGVLLLRPNSVPRTTSGKVQRVAMREQFRRGGLASLYEHLDQRLAAPHSASAKVGEVTR